MNYNALSAALRPTMLTLVHRCISGLQYNGKLTIDLNSSSTRSYTFIIQNSSLDCGFKGNCCLLGNIWGSLFSPPQAKIFKVLCLKWWNGSNLTMGLHMNRNSSPGSAIPVLISCSDRSFEQLKQFFSRHLIIELGVSQWTRCFQ